MPLLHVSISGEKPIPWRRRCRGVWGYPRLVSISGEKPIPWRRARPNIDLAFNLSFNLRREANPLATTDTASPRADAAEFQSQARSQSPGDWLCRTSGQSQFQRFNLRREANPLATSYTEWAKEHAQCFNLRREANPLATIRASSCATFSCKFQSQARSQSPGDKRAAPHRT